MSAITTVHCANCGTECPPQKRRANPRKYCSESCRLKHFRANNPDYVKRNSRRAKERAAESRARRLEERPKKTCPWCGNEFVAWSLKKKYCCEGCSRKHQHRKYRQRHGKFAVTEAERLAIYRRDGWVCQLCGEPVDSALHYLDPMAATLDHIVRQSQTLIPDHSEGNLRLAHRSCNSKRR